MKHTIRCWLRLFMPFLLAGGISLLVLMLLASCSTRATSAPPPRPTHRPHINSSGDAARGEALFTGVATDVPKAFVPCVTCHYLDPADGILVGPNMAGVAKRANTRIPGTSAELYLQQSIMRHDEFIVEGFEAGVMKSIVGDDFINIVPPEEIANVVAFLMTLTDETKRYVTHSAAVATADANTSEQLFTIHAGDVIPLHNGIVHSEQFTFQPPAQWETRRFYSENSARNTADIPSDIVQFVSRPTATTNTTPTTTTGIHAIAIAMGSIKQLNIPNINTAKITTTHQLFDTLLKRMEEETFALHITSVQTITIGGMSGRIATMEGWGFGDYEEPLVGSIAMAWLPEDTVLIMLAFADATATDTWDTFAPFHDVVASVSCTTTATTTSPTVYMPPTMITPISPTDSIVDHVDHVDHVDRDAGPRFACVQCHITHQVKMQHDSNPSCATCHSGTSYQRHCVDCHSIHSVNIPHTPNNPRCITCHPADIPGNGVDVATTMVQFLAYLFHEV